MRHTVISCAACGREYRLPNGRHSPEPGDGIGSLYTGDGGVLTDVCTDGDDCPGARAFQATVNVFRLARQRAEAAERERSALVVERHESDAGTESFVRVGPREGGS